MFGILTHVIRSQVRSPELDRSIPPLSLFAYLVYAISNDTLWAATPGESGVPAHDISYATINYGKLTMEWIVGQDEVCWMQEQCIVMIQSEGCCVHYVLYY